MERDDALKGGGYTVNLYLKVLKEEMPKCFKPNKTFKKDNISIYIAKKVKKYYEDNAISLLNWALYSPDINSIKHVWAKIKEWIYKHHLELLNLGKS